MLLLSKRSLVEDYHWSPELVRRYPKPKTDTPPPIEAFLQWSTNPGFLDNFLTRSYAGGDAKHKPDE